MSDLAEIQQRLFAAFGKTGGREAADAAGHDTAAEDFEALHGFEPETPPEPRGSGHPGDGRYRLWLAGGGLLAGALALGAQHWLGLYVLVAALGIIVLGSALIFLIQRHQESMSPETAMRAPPTLLQTMEGDLTVTRTMDRRVIEANETFRDITGCHQPQGKTCEDIGLAFRASGQPDRFDVELSSPRGQRIYVWQDILSRDARSGDTVIRSIGRDVTAERMASRAREDARRKAEKASAAKSRLLATVSHEIRTPLSGIEGMSRLLNQTKLDAEQRNYVDSIRQSADALGRLVEDLLDFSTIEVGRFRLHTGAESLRRLIESVTEMLASRAHEKGIEIASTVSVAIPDTLDFDAARLRQVLFNVIGNAVKFTQSGGVLVRAGAELGDLVICVTDTGPGMSEQDTRRIFAEFEQAGNAAERMAGTGLGLSISARIIREFGGSITVESERGEGSCFTIRFPVASLGAGGVSGRSGALKDSCVVVFAPSGPASTAIASLIRELDGVCEAASNVAEMCATLDRMMADGRKPTDIIVDHRLSACFCAEISGRADIARDGVRKIFLVNPEDRAQPHDGVFDAWLIRPLRERSLVDVLTGRMRGMENRDALNDNQPGIGLAIQKPEAGRGLNILVAEDDLVNTMLVQAMLRRAGHTVRHVDTFDRMLEIACAKPCERPDLIVTDLDMPGGAGTDMIYRIRAHELRQNAHAVPIIVLSADTREETRRIALLNGANRVLEKPVDPAGLIAEVEALAVMGGAHARVL